MAKMRVHDLAKEYGMQSKELLEHLADMKIPAKSASSTLEDAYISIVRKKLQPIMEARAAEIAAQKAAEEEAAAKEAKAAAEAAEAERLAAEARREAERAEEEKKRAKEEAARKKEEERRRAEEEKKRLEAEEAERNRVKDTAPKAAPSFNNLLDQIAQQEEVLKQQAAESAAQKKAEKGPRNHARANASEASGAPSRHNFKNERDDASMSDERPNGKRKKNRRGGDDGEDRYSRMAREAEAYNRSRVLDEARVAIEEASRESTGRRKKRKERRQKQAAEAAMEQRIEEALANDQDISQLDTVKVPQGSTVSELAELLGVPANDIIKRLFLLGNPLTLTETMSDELIEIVADDLGRQIKIMSKEEENSFTFYDDPKDLKPRPPVVTVMGHVDHGKTTIESINHAKAAGVPIVVAVNKIDKPGADPTRVRQELTEYGVIPEEWGGQNMFVDISAKQNLGIDDLLETILLQADVLELKANPDTFASGNVLEAKLDRGRGSVATVLVTRGTLHIGDALVAGMAFGRVRAMLDPKGNAVTTAGPSDAVEILGLQTVPGAGDEFRVFQEERDARELADQRALKARIEEQNRVKHVTLENLFDTMADRDVKELNLIIKADVQGSIEALQDSLDKMDQSEVRISTIHSAVGGITETDVVLADASNAIIIGFGVRPDAKAKLAAERVGVEIRTYSVIYKAIEEIDAARIGMLKPTEQEVQTGVAEVRDTFKVPKVGIAAGCMISEGEISRDDNIRLIRDGFVVYDGKIASLRRFKDDVKSVKSGYECGIGLENFQDIKPGDQLEGYRIEQVARTE